MRAVVQRVTEASVRVDGECVATMGVGLLVLVGVTHDDDDRVAQEMARKLVQLRIFEDESGRMNRSLLEIEGQLGVVSQFTLYGDCRKGRRPSFGEAADPAHAQPLIEALVEAARALGVTVVTGRFRETMQVTLNNDGPVTLVLDTAKRT